VINSNLSRISHRFPDIANFPLNFLLAVFNTQFENVSFRSLKFCVPKFKTHGLLFVQKTFPTTYLLARVHPLQTDRQTDGRQPCQ